jgi:low affinity Fe/Cu permease
MREARPSRVLASAGMYRRSLFDRFANSTSRFAGHPVAFAAAAGLIVLWLVSGPIFRFSDTWQLVINTATTIVTFLMVFLIQNTQNRDGAAIQTKLDELIRASAAQNVFIGIEHLTEEEVEELRVKCETRARRDLALEAADKAEDSVNRKAARAAERATS